MRLPTLVAYAAALAAVSYLAPALAQTKIYYVNGIQNTRVDARDSARAIARVLRESVNRTAASKQQFTVRYLYNPIGFSGTTRGCDLCQDKKELFLEKTAEEAYANDFVRILAPHNASSVLDSDAATRVKAYFDDLTPGGNSLEERGEATDSDLAATKQVIQSILGKFRETDPKVFVAHSQGNLLVNLAWAAYVSEAGQNARRNSRVVNVANTSRFSISGLNLTHGRDAALFSGATDFEDLDVSLETLPSQYSNWNRTTPGCASSACDFILTPSTFAGVNNTGGFLDHSFVETYLSSNDLPIVVINQGVTFTSGVTQFVDRFEDLVYAAADSLLPVVPLRPQYTTFELRGTITQIDPDAPASYLSDYGVNVGRAFRAVFTLNTSSVPSSGNQGITQYINAVPFSLVEQPRISTGGNAPTASSEVSVGANCGASSCRGYRISMATILVQDNVEIVLSDATGNAVPGTSLPTVALPISSFSTRTISYTRNSVLAGRPIWHGQISSWRVLPAIHLQGGDVLDVQFSFPSSFPSTPDLMSVGVNWFGSVAGGVVPCSLYDGSTLLGQSAACGTGTFASVDSSWPVSPFNPRIDFTSIVNRTISGRVEYRIPQGIVAILDPTASLGTTPGRPNMSLADCPTPLGAGCPTVGQGVNSAYRVNGQLVFP